MLHIFLSTPSARRATDVKARGLPSPDISIHALREEGDSVAVVGGKGDGVFLSTPSARRATHTQLFFIFADGVFLSTPSARRATPASITALPGTPHFYPRPPRGGRRSFIFGVSSWSSISIHALREEGDELHWALPIMCSCISIHALREEGDVRITRYSWPPMPFLSTPSARRATSP